MDMTDDEQKELLKAVKRLRSYQNSKACRELGAGQYWDAFQDRYPRLVAGSTVGFVPTKHPDKYEAARDCIRQSPRYEMSPLQLLPNVFDGLFDGGGAAYYRSLICPDAYPGKPKADQQSWWEPPAIPADETDDEIVPKQQEKKIGKRRYASDDPYAPWHFPALLSEPDTGYASRQFKSDVKVPKKARKAQGWSDADKGRWYRTHGAHGQDALPNARGDYARNIDNPTMYELHVETQGGVHVDPEARATREQLEVCRYCGNDLGLPRDEYGHVIREFETQRQYCSDRCEADADNARDRQARVGGRWPIDARGWYTAPEVTFDMHTITVSGVGRLDIPPSGWNRHNPRRDPHIVKARAGNHRDVFTLPLHEYVMKRRSGYFRMPSGQRRSDLALTGTRRVHRWRDSAHSVAYTLSIKRKQQSVWKITLENGALPCFI